MVTVNFSEQTCLSNRRQIFSLISLLSSFFPSILLFSPIYIYVYVCFFCMLILPSVLPAYTTFLCLSLLPPLHACLPSPASLLSLGVFISFLCLPHLLLPICLLISLLCIFFLFLLPLLYSLCPLLLPKIRKVEVGCMW